MSRPRLVLALALVTALLAGCSDASGPEPSASPSASSTASPSVSPSPTAGTGPRYVALGDSYTAGPGIAAADPASGLCARSLENYPHLLASALDAESVLDVSCSAATTATLLRGPGAQVPRVSASAELVTVGVGGNDGGLFRSLTTTCLADAARCRTFVRDTVPGVLATTRRSIVTVLRAVERRAPKALVVLVGYLGVAPARGGCQALGGIDASPIRAAQTALDATMAQAARDAGARYVSMLDASAGHDACSAEPWVNGASGTPDDGIFLHPRRAGMEAVARRVQSVVRAVR